MIKYVLTTKDDDIWEFDSLDEAKRNKYIFGGVIKEVDKDDKDSKSETYSGH
jgi:hypothetical protein